MDSGTRKEIAEIVAVVVRREFRTLRREIAESCAEILQEFSTDIAEALAQGNLEHFKKLAQDVYGPQARVYEVRTTDETLRRAAEQRAREQQKSELEITLDDVIR